MLLVASLLTLLNIVHGKVYLNENFDSSDWESRWVRSNVKSESESGKFVQSNGEWFVDENDFGVKTSQDARFYGYSTKLNEPLSNKDKDLFVQYVVKHEQAIDCGGAYLKILPKGLEQDQFSGDSKYAVMFGPDICGGNKRTHAILNYKGSTEKESRNMDHKGDIQVESDVNAHLYSFGILKDGTYQVKLDNEIVKEGELLNGWDFLPPATIKDPEAQRPEDWVLEAKIPDPADVKPSGYDDIPSHIPDPDAVMPEDWDAEDDGDWEAPLIDNPEFKGEWQPKLIDNPEYKGPWEHPMIANPDYFTEDNPHAVCEDCLYVGFELWQVKSGTLFDDIFITDDITEANEHAVKTMKKVKSINDEKKRIDDEEAAKVKETPVDLDEEREKVQEDLSEEDEKDEL